MLPLQERITGQAKALEALFPAENAGVGQPAHVFPVTAVLLLGVGRAASYFRPAGGREVSDRG
jgi:hypothetical protein